VKAYGHFAALLMTFDLLGCKPKETRLTGQVFIVTQSADNIKLGAVQVQLIEKKQVVEFLQNKQATIESQIALLRDEVNVAESNKDLTFLS
jgi:hypothetical protein